jgi:hypothetical protein
MFPLPLPLQLAQNTMKIKTNIPKIKSIDQTTGGDLLLATTGVH